MIPVDQTITNFETGNCMQACVASIFELPLDDVPNFMKDGKDNYANNIKIWSKEMGLSILDVELNEDFEKYMSNCYMVAVGKSPRGTKDWHRHGVIWFNGEMTHDPHPLKAGIDGKPEFFTIFIINDPTKNLCY